MSLGKIEEVRIGGGKEVKARWQKLG